MPIQSLVLDPNAQSYTDNQIVDKVNAASNQISRAESVAEAARPIEDGEVTSVKLFAGAAKANLDAMADAARGYIKTSPVAGQFRIISQERQADGKVKIDYDDVPV